MAKVIILEDFKNRMKKRGEDLSPAERTKMAKLNAGMKDWSKEPHHKHCCCDKCAPTKEDVRRIVAEFENLAPSDCE